jgi:hypothetical protein
MCEALRDPSNLPGFRLFVVVLVLTLFVVVLVPVALVIVLEVVVLEVVILALERRRRPESASLIDMTGVHAAGSVAGFGFSRFGGGYVDQKCRPQRGHTQN